MLKMNIVQRMGKDIGYLESTGRELLAKTSSIILCGSEFVYLFVCYAFAI